MYIFVRNFDTLEVCKDFFLFVFGRRKTASTIREFTEKQ